MTDETDIVSKGYLTTFFLDIDRLRNSLTGYRSIILRLNIDTKKITNIEKPAMMIDDQLKQALVSWSDEVRNSVERCQISYKALLGTVAKLKTDSLDEHYEKIIKIFTPDVEDVAKYTFEIHKCFIQGTLHEVLNKMDNYYEQYTKQ